MDVVAIIGLNVARQQMARSRAHLQRLEPVRYIGITTGTFDYIIEVVLPSMQALLHFLMSDLARVPGWRHTETSSLLDIPKHRYDWLPHALARPRPNETEGQPSHHQGRRRGDA